MLINVGSERPAVSDWASALSWGRDGAELVPELQAGSEMGSASSRPQERALAQSDTAGLSDPTFAQHPCRMRGMRATLLIGPITPSVLERWTLAFLQVRS